jgi:hypothetical protein
LIVRSEVVKPFGHKINLRLVLFFSKTEKKHDTSPSPPPAPRPHSRCGAKYSCHFHTRQACTAEPTRSLRRKRRCLVHARYIRTQTRYRIACPHGNRSALRHQNATRHQELANFTRQHIAIVHSYRLALCFLIASLRSASNSVALIDVSLQHR